MRPFHLLIPLITPLLSFNVVRAADAPAAAPGPATTPATAPSATDVNGLKGEEKRRLEQEVRGLPALGKYNVEDVIQFRLEDQDLLVYTNLEPTRGRSRVELNDMDGFTMVNVQGHGPNAPAKVAPRQPVQPQPNPPPQPQPPQGQQPLLPQYIQFEHYDLTSASAILVHTQIFAGPAYVQVARDVELVTEDRNISLIQQIRPDRGQPQPDGNDPAVKLFVKYISNLTGEVSVDLRLSADSIAELISKYPRETSEYLRPIFRDLKQEMLFTVKGGVAWQVLGRDLTPDPQTKAAVESILPRLNAGQAKDREAAENELRQFGPAGAAVLMKADRRRLSPEQNARIDAVLTPYHTLTDLEAQRMYSNADFLLDCLMSDDAKVRDLALRRLRDLTGKDLSFDTSADLPARAAALSDLRKRLLPPPATQAAKPFERRG